MMAGWLYVVAEQKGRDFGKDGREIEHGFGLLRLDGSGGGFSGAVEVCLDDVFGGVGVGAHGEVFVRLNLI